MPRSHHHYAGLHQPLAVGDQAVNAGDADVVDRLHLVAHGFGGDLRFFGHGDVAGARAYHRDFAFAMNGAVAPESHGARQREIFGLGKLLFQFRWRFARRRA